MKVYPRREMFMDQAVFGAGSVKAADRIRTAVIVSIQSAIALIHLFRLGTYLPGTFVTLYYSYFSDIVVPFGIYFLLCVPNVRSGLFHNWRVRALVVFLVASATEIMQGFGVPLLGRTFDPLDFVMFSAGVLLAILVDRVFLARFLPAWSPRTAARTDAIQSKAL